MNPDDAHNAAMNANAPLDDLLRHVCDSSRLTRSEAERLVEEVLAYFDEPVAAFVARRHKELKAAGWQNDAIYQRLLAELESRRFPAPGLSLRQVRRLIYG